MEGQHDSMESRKTNGRNMQVTNPRILRACAEPPPSMNGRSFTYHRFTRSIRRKVEWSVEKQTP